MNPDKRIVIPRPILPSSSSPRTPTQNRFAPLIPTYSSITRPRNRTPYSPLAHLQGIPPSISPYNKSPTSVSLPIRPKSPSINTEVQFHTNHHKQTIKILEPFEEQKLNQGSPSPSCSTRSMIKEDSDDIARRIRDCKEEDLARIISEIRSSPSTSEDLYQDSRDPYDIRLNQNSTSRLYYSDFHYIKDFKEQTQSSRAAIAGVQQSKATRVSSHGVDNPYYAGIWEGESIRVSTMAGRFVKNPNNAYISAGTNPYVVFCYRIWERAAVVGVQQSKATRVLLNPSHGVDDPDSNMIFDTYVRATDYTNSNKVTANDYNKSMNGDVIKELFGVSLTTPKDIDTFTSDLESGKYEVWSELTREKRNEIMDTIWSIWKTLMAGIPTETNANSMPSKVSSSDPIVQSVFIHEETNFLCWCSGRNEIGTKKVVETVSTRFDNTLYGYFIGKRITFPVVEYYARNNWGKYGLTRIMMNSNGFFFFKFKADVLENGPWMIRNSPIIMKKWSIDRRLCKEELTRIPVWVKIHNVAIQVFSEDGLSIISSQICKPIMLDSYTSSKCIESWGRSSFAHCLIEIDAEDVLKESLTLGVPLIEGSGFTCPKVDDINVKLSASDASFVKAKTKGKEQKKKIKSLTKNLDHLSAEVAHLTSALNQANVLEAKRDAEIQQLKASPLKFSSFFCASTRFECGLKVDRSLLGVLNNISYFVLGAQVRLAKASTLVATTNYPFLNKISDYATHPLSAILQLESKKLAHPKSVPTSQDTCVSPHMTKESTVIHVSSSLELPPNDAPSSSIAPLGQNEEWINAMVDVSSNEMADGAANDKVPKHVSFSPDDVVVALSIGEKDNGSSLPLSASEEEDPNRDGERGFDYLTSALVSSKADHEGYIVYLGEDPIWASKGRPLSRRGGYIIKPPSRMQCMSVKNTLAIQRCELSRKELDEFLSFYPIPSEYRVILPTSTQTILDAPPGYIGLYTHCFSLANLRLPLNDFFCEAYDYEPSVELFHGFINLCKAGSWLTVQKRSEKHIQSLLAIVITRIEGWHHRFLFIQDTIVPSKFPQLLLKENMLNVKSFKDELPSGCITHRNLDCQLGTSMWGVGAAKVSHFEILCRVHGFQPSINLFRAFYTSSYTKGWLSFIKRSDAAPVCYIKPLDSVKNWNDHFFWVDSTVFPLSVSLKSKILSKDPPPKPSQYKSKAREFLWTHTAPFRKFPEPFLCWVGISRYYTLDENSYPTFWDGDEGGYILSLRLRFCFIVIIPNTFVVILAEMDLFTFIRHSDPTKVWVGERNLADRELKLMKMTEGRTVALDPPATVVSGGSSDNIDRLFDEGNYAGQDHSAERDDIQEEAIAKDASGVVVEKPQKKQKRKVIGDASGSVLPPKRLRDDHQSLPPRTGGKSLTALCGIVSDGSIIPSDATRPAVTASVTPTPDVKTVDSVSGQNLRTRPPHVRYVVSSDSSLYSDSYSEAASLVRSVTDAPVVTIAVTTTIDANIAAGSKAKDVLREIEHTRYSASAGRLEADAVSISKLKQPSISSDSFYASQSLDTEALHPLRAMDYDHLYSEFNVRAARQVCLGAKVRMRTEHTLEKKNELEDKCAGKAILLFERDTEIAHLKSLLSLKEAEATEAISLRGQLTILEATDASKGAELRDLKEKNFALEGEKNALCDRVEALESAAASKEVELTSLSSQVAKLTADLSGFQISRDELNSKVASLESKRDCIVTQRSSLESAFELFKEQVEKMQDEQVGVLIDRVVAIDSDLMEMALHMDAEFYPRYLTTIVGQRWLLNRGLKLVLSKCLSSPEYLSVMGEAIGRAIDKGMQDGLVVGIENGVAGRSITDVAVYNPSVKSDYVAAINALQSVSFLLLAQLEAHKDAKDQVVIGETSLAFSLEVAHNRVQRLRGDATARRLSLTDSIRPLVEPLSSRVLTGDASSFADVTVTTALATTFSQTFPIPAGASTKVPPSPKIVFEEEELDTTLEHALAP
ncbi:gypsy type transposase [Tanacetum coccineum]|uniref:Gypsy type transposase n=1 Tax=Tanacetum coccineum TaxID=301880 RepID=A0ABQ5I2T8_9ASTR